jgi:hypothetical protein
LSGGEKSRDGEKYPATGQRDLIHTRAYQYSAIIKTGAYQMLK